MSSLLPCFPSFLHFSFVPSFFSIIIILVHWNGSVFEKSRNAVNLGFLEVSGGWGCPKLGVERGLHTMVTYTIHCQFICSGSTTFLAVSPHSYLLVHTHWIISNFSQIMVSPHKTKFSQLCQSNVCLSSRKFLVCIEICRNG